MTAKQQPLDITDSPELSRLVDQVYSSSRPLVLQRGGEDVAVLMSLRRYPITPPPPNPALDAVLAGLPRDSVVARTAGALHTDQPFLGTEEERELAAILMARELVAGWEADDGSFSPR